MGAVTLGAVTLGAVTWDAVTETNCYNREHHIRIHLPLFPLEKNASNLLSFKVCLFNDAVN